MLRLILENPDLDFRFHHVDGGLLIRIKHNKHLGLIKEVNYKYTKEYIPKDERHVISMMEEMISQVRL